MVEDRFFEAGDVDALAKKIEEFIDRPLTDEEKRTQLNKISERYNRDKIADKTFEVYQRLLEIMK